jgi:peptidoglycan/xylan/chitin deacetylase (PgdA/CDA1 family)
MFLDSGLSGARRLLLCSIHCRRVCLGNQGPVVSFCFDDFPRTAYTVGGAVLKRFGARGTYYAAISLMNTRNHLGDQFTKRDLDSLLEEGHELGSHTLSHVSCRSVPFQVFENDLHKGRDAIRELTGYDPTSFAYPYGHATLTAKKRLGAQMSSCRGICGGLNGPMVDLNLLRANSLEGDTDRFAELKSLLWENERRRSWLIFYTHDVRQNPSPFGCTPSLLEQIVSVAAERGFRIASVREVLSCLRAASPGGSH